VVGLIGLAGCGDPPPPDPLPSTPVPRPEYLDISLAELLNKPRGELASQVAIWEAKVEAQEKALRDGGLHFALLPDLRFPLILPAFREARFSARVGISLPPYAREGTVNEEFALHLARYGDLEGAKILAASTGSEVQARMEDYRCSRNYPVEWSRLVGLLLHYSEVRLAIGDGEGAQGLIFLHHQLREILDAKAAEGPLGAALLPRGHEALIHARKACGTSLEAELGSQIDAALAQWGPMSAPLGLLRLGASRADLGRLLDCQTRERVAAVPIGRALDLLGLPVPGDGIQGIYAFFSDAGQLTAWLISYRAREVEAYPDAAQMGQTLTALSIQPVSSQKLAGINQAVFETAGISMQCTVIPRGLAAGALIQFQASSKSSADSSEEGKLPRDFGILHLDRSFEQNRLRLAPEQQGNQVQTKKAAVLSEIVGPLDKLTPTQVVLERQPAKEAVLRIVFRYAADRGGLPSLARYAMPLWLAAGPATLDGIENDSGGAMDFVWQRGPTRYTLELPYSADLPVELIVENTPHAPAGAVGGGPGDFDEAERKTRLAQGHPLVRLPRQLENVQLGQTRDEALPALPHGQSIVKQPFPDGMSVTFTADPAPTAVSQVRQLLLRFGADSKLVEIRARCVPGPAAPDNWTRSVVDSWKKTCGAPRKDPSTWTRIWGDLPSLKTAPLQNVWRDDITRLTVEGTAGTLDVTLRDCPAEHALGIPLAPLNYLPRGPERCPLGTDRQDLLKSWKVDRPIKANGVDLVLHPGQDSPYDALLVWFQGDRVQQVQARHRLTGKRPPAASPMEAALTSAWGKELGKWSWPCRRDLAPDRTVQSMGWNDERTRIRLYWQESEEGAARVFTEWRDLADLDKAVAAKP
jgi:hypothetical protein